MARLCPVILGATATGKTSLAVTIAKLVAGEIVSADSRQVYRSLDLGTGKDLGEYGAVRHHLIDVVSLPDEYNVFTYQRDAYAAIDSILARGAVPVIVGGTGMYVDALVRGYRFSEAGRDAGLRAELDALSDEELARRLSALLPHLHNSTDTCERDRLVRAIEIAEASRREQEPSARRPGFDPLCVGVRFPRAVMRERIARRLDERIRSGMIDEVSRVHESGISWERLERLGLEYRVTAEYLQGKIASLTEYRDILFREICRFAKRQETWFRGMERKGVPIEWFEGDDPRAAATYVANRVGKRA